MNKINILIRAVLLSLTLSFMIPSSAQAWGHHNNHHCAKYQQNMNYYQQMYNTYYHYGYYHAYLKNANLYNTYCNAPVQNNCTYYKNTANNYLKQWSLTGNNYYRQLYRQWLAKFKQSCGGCGYGGCH